MRRGDVVTTDLVLFAAIALATGGSLIDIPDVGHGRIDPLPLGSTTGYIPRRSPIPVLTGLDVRVTSLIETCVNVNVNHI